MTDNEHSTCSYSNTGLVYFLWCCILPNFTICCNHRHMNSRQHNIDPGLPALFYQECIPLFYFFIKKGKNSDPFPHSLFFSFIKMGKKSEPLTLFLLYYDGKKRGKAPLFFSFIKMGKKSEPPLFSFNKMEKKSEPLTVFSHSNHNGMKEY